MRVTSTDSRPAKGAIPKFYDLHGGLAGAVDDLRRALTQRAMMIDFGKAKIFKRRFLAENGVLHTDFAVPNCWRSCLFGFDPRETSWFEND
jgi:hypothetical protein